MSPNDLDKKDLTGKNRMVSNVLLGWLAQLIFVAAGFILPRMIDSRIDKDALGIWDFAWSLITYFDIIQSGLISSISRYVARYRASGDIASTNIAVSSVFCVLLAMATVVAILAAGGALLMPHLLSAQLGAHMLDAQWLIFLLGLNLAIKMPLGVFGGVITGCHRWDLQYGISVAVRVTTLLGMVAVLLLGGGLKGLAFVYLCCETAVLCSRCSLTYRVCPGLQINLRHAQRRTAVKMWRFGLKNLLPNIGDLINNQTFNLLLIWFLGPAALAGYARPRSIVRHIQTFAIRYAFPLSPTASSIQAIDTDVAITKMMVDSCRTGALIVLPMAAILAVMGKPILLLWMGKGYAEELLPVVLAVGYLPLLLQLPLQSIMHGLNTHGWPGLFKFIAAVVGICFAFVALQVFHSEVLGAAVVVCLPFWLSEFIATPLVAKRRHGLSLKRYYLAGLGQPLLIVAPMVACLLICRIVLLNASAALTLLVGFGVGLPVLAVCYWKYAIDATVREKAIRPFITIRKRLGNHNAN